MKRFGHERAKSSKLHITSSSKLEISGKIDLKIIILSQLLDFVGQICFLGPYISLHLSLFNEKSF
jgi:hypothetical protein